MLKRSQLVSAIAELDEVIADKSLQTKRVKETGSFSNRTTAKVVYELKDVGGLSRVDPKRKAELFCSLYQKCSGGESLPIKIH